MNEIKAERAGVITKVLVKTAIRWNTAGFV